MRVCIIGCGPAGMECAMTIKKLKPKTEVIVFGKEKNIAVKCSLPYAISGETKLEKCVKPDEMLTKRKINIIREEVTEVDTKLKKIRIKKNEYKYDKLVFATGARPFVPSIKGVDSKNVFTLRDYSDAKKILKFLKNAKYVGLIGGGLISVELGALLSKKHKVTIFEILPDLLYSTYDQEICKEIEKVMEKNKVKLELRAKVESIIGDGNISYIKCKNKKIRADAIILATGVRPEVELAKNSGIKCGKFGIITDKKMQTNIKDIYAIGDCAQSFSLITKKPVPSGLVISAVREAKIAAKNICGIETNFEGLLNPSAAKIFNYCIGRVGLTEREAIENNIKVKILKSELTTKYDTQKKFGKIKTKLIFDSKDRLLGAQFISSENIADLISFASFAIYKKIKREELAKLSYPAHPELTSLPFFNPVVSACEK